MVFENPRAVTQGWITFPGINLITSDLENPHQPHPQPPVRLCRRVSRGWRGCPLPPAVKQRNEAQHVPVRAEAGFT